MNLFAYGTLMCPEIMQRVTGVLPEALPARLDGYRRGPLAGVDYPAIFPRREAGVEGLLYLDLPPWVWPRLDLFEGTTYSRRTVEVTLGDGTNRTAEAYVLNPEYLDRLLEAEWSFTEFLATGKKRFEKDYENFPAADKS